MNNEVWKQIEGFSGFYQVSNYGRVKSIDRITRNGRHKKALLKGKLLKQNKFRNGYLFVGLHDNGFFKTCRVHRIVATTFIPNPKGYSEVNHKNGIKTDNRACNLEWCTRKGNMEHAKANGLTQEKGVIQYKQQNPISVYKSLTEASKITGIPQSNISNCISGKLKTTGGFSWKAVNY